MKKVIDTIRPLIFQPFTKNRSLLPDVKINNFFLSFGNALICIFNHYKISGKKESILMPNFYCIETLNFIGKHLKIIFYKVNNDFSIDKNTYFRQIEKYKPRIILNYAFLGFTLTAQEKQKLLRLCGEETIIIEDYAHKFLLHSKIFYINKNHFYIDSIRKHCSLLGSHLVNPDFHYSKESVDKINSYKIKCLLIYSIYRILVIFVYLFRSAKINSYAEKVFMKLNSIIGKSPGKPTLGSSLSFYLYGLIDFKKIERHNKSILMEFNRYFSKFKNNRVRTLTNEILASSSLLNYYPIFIDEEIQPKFIEYLSKNNIFPWRLWDIMETPYISELNIKLYKSFLVFPIHWLISKKDVESIFKEANNFFNNTNYSA